MYELDHFEEKAAKVIQIVFQKGQIRIRYNYSGSGSDRAKKFRIRWDLESLHCYEFLLYIFYTVTVLVLNKDRKYTVPLTFTSIQMNISLVADPDPGCKKF